MSLQSRGYLAVILSAILWGVAGVTAKYLFAARSIHPFLLVQIRMGLSFLLLLVILAAAAPHLLRLRREETGFLAIWGVLGMAAVQFTYFLTISETNVATAIFLQYLAPILIALYAWLVEGQQLGKLVIACLGMSVAGSVLLIFGGTSDLLISPLGLASGLSAAGFMAFYTIYGAKGVGRLSPWTLLCYGLGTGFLFWLLVDAVLLLGGRLALSASTFTDSSLWPFFAYIVVLATIVPFGLFLTGLKWVPPTRATITGMLEPVVAGLASYFLLGETLRPMQLAGGGLIVAAVILLQIGQSRATL